MRYWARLLYIIGNCLMVCSGLFHTWLHVVDMMGPKLEATLRAAGTLDVQGFPLEIWNLFQGQSLLLGFVIITLGLSNLVSLEKQTLPPVGTCLVCMILFVGNVVVGALFLGPIQTVGGSIGTLMFGVTPVAWLLEKRRVTI